jgi:hypothetical protein
MSRQLTLLALTAPLLLASCMVPMGPVDMPPHVVSRTEGAVALPLRFRAEAPHVTGSINGWKPLLLLADTGASVCVFDSNIGAATGIAPTGGSANLRGVHGRTSARSCIVRSLDMGVWKLENVPCYVRRSTVDSIGGPGSAILGIDQMRRHFSHVTFDYRRGVLECGRGTYRPRTPNATHVPFRTVGGLPTIRLSAGSLVWEAVVDTGSSWGIVIDQATAARLGQASGGQGLGPGVLLSGVGGSVRADRAGARIIRVPEVSLCGQSYPGAELYVMPGPMRIGSRFWHGTRMTLDFTTSTLWVER